MRGQILALLLFAVFSNVTAAQERAAAPNTIPPPIQCMAFSPDSQALAASTTEIGVRGELAIWNRGDWQLRFHYSEGFGFPRFAFSPDGERLALCRFAPELKMLDAHTGKVLIDLVGHNVNARCACFSDQGKTIITGSDDRTIRIWNAQSGALMRTLPEHTAGIADIAVSSDGQHLITADAPQVYKAHLWDLKTETVTKTFEQFDTLVSHVAYSPDGKFVTISSWAGMPRICIADTGEIFRHIAGLGGSYWAIFSPDQRWLAVGSTSENVLLFDGILELDEKTEGRMALLLEQLDSDSYQDREEASREFISLGGAAIPLLRDARDSPSAEIRWRARKLLQRIDGPSGSKKLPGHQAAIKCVCFSPDGQLLASADNDGVIKVWNVGDWTEVTTLSMPFKP